MTQTAFKTPKEIRDKVLARIDGDRLVALCSKLIRIDSVVENPGAEVEIAAFVADYFRKLKLDVKEIDLPKDIPGQAEGDHPQVVVTRPGKGRGPRLLIGGHLDTEPIVNPELWTHHPLSGDVADGYIYGVGAVNMKQSVASFMEAFKAIVDSGVELEGDLLFAGWSQENGGLLGSKYMAAHWDELGIGRKPDMVFDGEQTDCSVWSTNVGMAVFTITTYGRLGHNSSRYTLHPAYDGYRQVNAVDKMLKILNEVKDVRKNFVYERGQFLGDPIITFGRVTTKVPGTGSRPCLGVEECSVMIDIRYPGGMNKQSVRRDLERIIYNLRVEDPTLRATVIGGEPVPGEPPDKPVMPPRDLPLLSALKLAHKEIFGEELIVDIDSNGTTLDRVVDWCRYAGSDLVSFANVGIPGLNYGPGVVPVTPDEKVSVEQLIKHCKVSALAILEVVGVRA